jgi:hypothetical protein
MRRFSRRLPSERLRMLPAWAPIAAILLLTLSLSACTISLPDIAVTQGSGTEKTETRAVSGFTGVTLKGIGTLNIRQTGTESLTITTDDNLLPLLTSTVSNGVLELGAKDRTIPRPTNGVTWNVTVKNLSSVTLTGAGTVNVQDVNTTSLASRISGAGTMNLSGKTNSQSISVSGAGNYSGRNLSSTNATVSISGAGNAAVNVSGTLDATVSGAGAVTYYGTPAVTQHISGTGVVRQGR